MYFSAGDGAGIGVAKSTTGRPEGPYADVLGKPLVPTTVFGAEPIDAQVFIDDDERVWLYFGGWSHAVVVELESDMVSLKGEYLEITPKGYVEGPWMMKSEGVYYFMFSVGGYVSLLFWM
jgi:beta-xylosidase